MNTFKRSFLASGSMRSGWRKAAFALGAVVSMTFSACESYVGGNVNVDPTRPAPSQVTIQSLLPSTILFTANSQYRVAFLASQWSQQTAWQQAGGADSHITSGDGSNSAWQSIYLDALTTLSRASLLARDTVVQAPHYRAVFNILQAVNLSYATDFWENIPFSQAFQGQANFTPSYDTQQQLYGRMDTLLREAITLLEGNPRPVPISPVPGNDDLVFRGGTAGSDRWRRVANTLLARNAIHLTAKGSRQAATNALTALRAGTLRSNADDFDVPFAAAAVPSLLLQNANETVQGRIFTILFSDYYMSSMVAMNDPRLPLIARGTPTTNSDQLLTSFIGAVNGNGTTTMGRTANAYITPLSWYPSNPLQILTFAESKFIEAEALFLEAGGTPTSLGAPAAARTALVDGIRANMTKMGIAATTVDTYLRQIPSADSVRLSTIMMEKFKTIFLNPEVWVDMRRYDYNASVFPNLRLPLGHNPDLQGRWIQRAIYPTSEQTRNAQAFRANWTGTNAAYAAEKMWRDRP
ncbi:MAG: SusD/RagB family nutrient-binding outer membrane lipoprotein [Candidatus Kapaibacterium sp.]|nr:MAG: SusD/RagB family nutrient-binding outer membrane lipoprotein [Candidatus Kapabacteria bacterium]